MTKYLSNEIGLANRQLQTSYSAKVAQLMINE